jgi:sugar-specific transcriptional regulator TrmB
MELVNKIEQLGLSEKESSVYLASLELGESTVTEIAKRAGQKRPTVYLALHRLYMLGLVAETVRGKKKFWTPVHPKRLKELAEFRATQINKALPELLALYKENTRKPSVKMLEGTEGIKNAYAEAFNLLAEEQNEGLWIGNISILIEKFPVVLKEYNDLLRKLKKCKIRELIFGGEQSRQWVLDAQKHSKPNHRVKYLNNPGGITDQLVVGNKVFFFSMDKELFTTVMEGGEIAKTQSLLFETIWENIK